MFIRLNKALSKGLEAIRHESALSIQIILWMINNGMITPSGNQKKNLNSKTFAGKEDNSEKDVVWQLSDGL